MRPYPLVDDLVRSVLRVRMPRAPRVVAPGGTMHVVARCNSRMGAIANFEVRISRRSAMSDKRRARVAYTLMWNRVSTLHPSYLALSPYPKVRQRQYRALQTPSPDPTAYARDSRWSSQRAMGSAPFVARYTPARPPPNRFRASPISGTWSVRCTRYFSSVYRVP